MSAPSSPAESDPVAPGDRPAAQERAGSRDSHAPQDPVEALVAAAIERGGGAEVVAELCARAPEHAEPLRARLARLEQLGLLGPLARAEHSDFGPRYRLIGRLGRGGMGVVYLAFDRERGEQVALKVCEGAGARAGERFQREIAQHARLRHPGLVSVLDAGAVDGVPYFAMEFVDGETLAEKLTRLRAGATDLAQRPADALLPARARGYIEAACWIARDVARALAYVHAHGIVHRDVKPANVLVARDGRVLLLDLGLAHLVDAPALTRTGDLAGTPAYMAPEQVSGSPTALDARADVYALCALLYELIALRPPFGADGAASAARVLHAVQHQEPVALTALVPGLPRALETIVHQGLAKAPRERYASADELADDLERLLSFQPIRARPPSPARRARRWSRRRPAAALALGVGAALLVAGPLALYKYGRDVSAERDRARGAATAARAEAERNLEATRFLEGLFQRLAESGDPAAATLALDVLQQGVRDLEGGVLLSDATRARLFEAVARVYHGLARTSEAVPLYDRALALRQRALGEAHVETIANLQQLASAHVELGDLVSARAILGRVDAALRSSAAQDGRDDGDALTRDVRIAAELTRGDLARATGGAAQDGDAARACYERALALALEAQPTAPKLEAEARDRLGALDVAAGAVEAGAAQLARAVELRRRLPDTHVLPLVASLRALARAQLEAGAPERAAEALDSALLLLRKSARGALLVEVADERLALPVQASLELYALRSAAAERPVQEPPRPAQVSAFGRAFQLGITALQAERWSEAEQSFAAALELSPRHPMCAYNAACALARGGRGEAALEWLARALEYGFGSREQAESLLGADPDLTALRELPAFAALRERARAAGRAARAFAAEPALYVPESGSEPRPLLLVLHADGETKADVLTGPWRALSDATGCALVAPSATLALAEDPAQGMRWSLEAPDSREQRWLVERPARDALAFALARARVDPRRCFVAGMGRSGERAFELALASSELFAGVLVADALIARPEQAERARAAAALGLRSALVADLSRPLHGLDAGAKPEERFDHTARTWSAWGLHGPRHAHRDPLRSNELAGAALRELLAK